MCTQLKHVAPGFAQVLSDRIGASYDTLTSQGSRINDVTQNLHSVKNTDDIGLAGLPSVSGNENTCSYEDAPLIMPLHITIRI